jgi:hypothetical protein
MGIFYEFFRQNEKKNWEKFPKKFKNFFEIFFLNLKKKFQFFFYFSYFHCGNFELFWGQF